jgi:hypothetical protein
MEKQIKRIEQIETCQNECQNPKCTQKQLECEAVRKRLLQEETMKRAREAQKKNEHNSERNLEKSLTP